MPRPDAIHTAVRLRGAVSALMRRLRSEAAPDGPGTAKLSVLGQLYRLGPLTPTQLAGHERVKPQTLTRLLSELEAAGCLTRRPHEADGRQTLLELSPAGAELLMAEVRRRESSLAEALQTQLTAAERAQLLAACELLDRLAEAPSPSLQTAGAA